MAELVANCPRCGAEQMTFDAVRSLQIGMTYGWKRHFEAFSICRNCRKSTTFVVTQKDISFNERAEATTPEALKSSLNPHFSIERYLSLRDRAQVAAPEHTPQPIADVFTEAATCLSMQCWNATGAMLRLCIDLATKQMLPTEEMTGLNSWTRKTLAPRLIWLFENSRLPNELRDLSNCIREDGNDAAHDGTLRKEDAEDLLDFVVALFERMYTEPEKLRLAQLRREQRRAKPEA